MMACKSNPNAPDLTMPRGWITDSKTVSIYKKVSKNKYDQIFCSDSEFDNKICYNVDDIEKLMKELEDASWKCEKWRSNGNF